MKQNLQDVIIFLGSSIRFFARQMFINFGILALLMAFTLLAFHLHIKHLHSFAIFLMMVIVGFLLTRWLQIRILFKNHIILQYAFITYRISGQARWQLDHLAGYPKDHIKQTKDGLKSKGAGIFANYLAKFYSVVFLAMKKKGLPTEEQIRHSRKWSMGSFAWQVVVLLILLLPFAVVSLLLTMGIELQLRLVIFIVGLWFVWFLYMAMVNPIFRLVLLDKIYQQCQVDE